jgi:hypothetical protein
LTRVVFHSLHDMHSAKVENAHKEFQKAIGAALVWYVPERGVLAVTSRCSSSQRRADMLQEMHFRYTPTLDIHIAPLIKKDLIQNKCVKKKAPKKY